MKRHGLWIGAVVAALSLFTAPPGRAADKPAPVASPPASRALGTDGAWTAYVSDDHTGRVCYLVGQPEKSAPASARRKPPSAMITHRPQENIANVVSFVEGYALKDGSNVSIVAGKNKFDLFTKEDSAWARTPDLDKEIVNALAKSRSVVVKGVPSRGPVTTDTYSLAGFGKTLALIDKACGVKR